MESKLTKHTLIGFAWMLTGSGVQVLLKVCVLAVLARLVSPQEFGIAGVAIIALEFSKMFTQMGIGPAIVQLKNLNNSHLTTGLSLSFVTGIFFASTLFIAAPHLADFFLMRELVQVLKVISLVFLVESITLVGYALMQRNMRFKAMAGIEIISYTLGYGVVGITLGFLGWGKWAIIIALLIQSVVQALLILIIQPFPKTPKFKLNALKELIHFGGGFTLARIGNYIALQGDNLVIGRMLGPAALGLYGRAYQFMVMPAALFGTALDQALFPAMARVQDNKIQLGNAFLTGLSFIALIGVPLSIISITLAQELIYVLLGPAWLEVKLPFQILACSMLFRMSYKISDTLVRATGAVYKRAWRQLVYAGMVVFGAYVGQFWGLSGVAFGVAIALLTNFLLMTHLSVQITKISWLDVAKAHKQGLILGIITLLTSHMSVMLFRQLSASSLFTLALTSLWTTLFSALAVWLLPSFFLSVPQRELLKKLFQQRFKNHPRHKSHSHGFSIKIKKA